MLVLVGTPAFLHAQEAGNDIRMTAGTNYPDFALIGNPALGVSVTFGNSSIPADGTTSIIERLDYLEHQVSCNNSVARCLTGVGEMQDPPIFTPTATGTGGLQCTGVTFTIAAVVGVPGLYTFTPSAFVAPATSLNVDLDLGQNCRVSFTVSVDGLPTVDLGVAPGRQIVQTTFATSHVVSTTTGADIGAPAEAAAPDLTTVQVCATPGVQCRASAGVCDPAELCTEDFLCPADLLSPATTECRASGGICDVAESCTGTTAACPDENRVAATT
jgi:hypothetical protein